MIISDIAEFYDTTVMVSRYIKVGTSTATQLKSVIVSLPCMIQADRGKLVMASSGQVSVDYQLLYCDFYDSAGSAIVIKDKDIITVLTAPGNINVNKKYLVLSNDCFPGFIDHMEVSIQGGTV